MFNIKKWILNRNLQIEKNHALAFTLAEVLMVLGIIGVVAAITIPSLIRNYEDTAASVTLKKEVSTLQQAINMAKSQEGRIEDWYSGNDFHEANVAVRNVLIKYLKVAKNCEFDLGCLPQYNWLSTSYSGAVPDFDSDSSISKIILNDGTILFFGCSTDRALCDFYIDVNGLKGPNRFGYDLFRFRMYSETLASTLPVYRPQIIVPYSNTPIGDLKNTCNVHSSSDGGDGQECSTWVYYQGNRDYLHCDNLNWQTKTKCD